MTAALVLDYPAADSPITPGISPGAIEDENPLTAGSVLTRFGFEAQIIDRAQPRGGTHSMPSSGEYAPQCVTWSRHRLGSP